DRSGFSFSSDISSPAQTPREPSHETKRPNRPGAHPALPNAATFPSGGITNARKRRDAATENAVTGRRDPLVDEDAARRAGPGGSPPRPVPGPPRPPAVAGPPFSRPGSPARTAPRPPSIRPTPPA